MRFKAGTTDYLEVLTDETNSFSAELGWHRPRRTNSLLWSSSTKLWAAVGNNWTRLYWTGYPLVKRPSRPL